MASESHENPPTNLPHSVARFMESVSSNFFSRFSSNTNKASSSSSSLSSSSSSSSSLGVSVPLLFADAPVIPFPAPFSISHNQSGNSSISAEAPRPAAAIKSMPSGVRMDGLNPSSKGGPAFVGQVYSMCDPSGTGLMAVTAHFEIPFLSKRTPEWIKKMLAKVTKNEKNGPMFRFFMDLSDAVGYVKRLNIPTGMVGACRLDVAYEHFKEKPHMFQFVPNEKQVKEANKLLKKISRNNRKRRVEGVPVFTAQNLNIAIATVDGIKWYTPYFFDKSLLDNILEASIDQHFHTLIQNRHMQRRRDVIDDDLAAEVVEENVESLFEPPEVQEVLDEMGHPSIPLSVISKAAEIQLLDVVDKVLLGNKWLRKATGIQPKFPYLVDSFEERSAASFQRAMESTCSIANSDAGADRTSCDWQLSASESRVNETTNSDQDHSTTVPDFRFPFGNWFSNPWSKPSGEQQNPDKLFKSGGGHRRTESSDGEFVSQLPPNPLLPKITMVGISTGEGGQVSRASLKKTIEDLTKDLEQTGQRQTQQSKDKDPLFVANVGDFSGMTKTS
eukprot:TRINITY_DN12340_c0_g1_i1.p1 TRINITY_DN12340_c0_g1~~TRINITY_DN12340_c0_g1_i1.p1  ORF type:complete len:558 (-),score=114.46 TRINITY_DN12340_c0_g1_i1:420-2093(-)